jgi:hypothetical protein
MLIHISEKYGEKHCHQRTEQLGKSEVIPEHHIMKAYWGVEV